MARFPMVSDYDVADLELRATVVARRSSMPQPIQIALGDFVGVRHALNLVLWGEPWQIGNMAPAGRNRSSMGNRRVSRRLQTFPSGFGFSKP